MGYQKHGDALGPVYFPQENLEMSPDGIIQCREGLIKEKNPGIRGKGPGQHHPLAHASRKLGGVEGCRIRQSDKGQQFRRFRNPVIHPGTDRERHIVQYRQPREKLIVSLKYELPIRGRFSHRIAIDEDSSGFRCIQ